MFLTRPCHLLVQRRDRPEFSLEDLLRGGAGLRREPEWLALAPHLDEPQVITLSELAVLDALGSEPVERERLLEQFPAATVDRLVGAGLVIGDHEQHQALREREQALRGLAWWTPALVAQAFGRWIGVDVGAEEARQGRRSLQQLIATYGPPPAATIALHDQARHIPLQSAEPRPLDELFAARRTCRNFDPEAELALAELSRLLGRVFGARAEHRLAPEATVLKKSSPSGGGLHPIEAYLLVQRVAGLAPGLYHYLPVAHALEPLDAPVDADWAALAHELVAGQPWFAVAPVQVLLAARFDRSYWKYRNHAKAWRVVQLDAGHLSQTLLLSATEQGLGSFITAAINDRCAERLFGFDGLVQGAVAVCGFGPRVPGQYQDELGS